MPEKGRILRVKQGYNPNSSSIGSTIFVMSAAVLPAVVFVGVASSAIATAVLQRVGRTKDEAETTESDSDEQDS